MYIYTAYFIRTLARYWYGFDDDTSNRGPYKLGSIGLCFPSICDYTDVLSIVQLIQIELNKELETGDLRQGSSYKNFDV